MAWHLPAVAHKNRVLVLLVTLYPQKQAMDLVHRKCFEKKKVREQWMDDWFPSIPLQHFNANRQAWLPSQEQRTESELSAPLRNQACFSCRMPSPAAGTTKLSLGARLQSKSKTDLQPAGVDPLLTSTTSSYPWPIRTKNLETHFLLVAGPPF